MSIDRGNYRDDVFLNYARSLKIVREHSGKTQKEVAELVGVSITTVSHWETGRKVPNVEHAKRLNEIYDISVEDKKYIEILSTYSKKQLIHTIGDLIDEQ